MAKKPKTLDVPIGQLTESELNPRRTFDEDALKDLADSIAADGILQTLLVRPLRLVNGRELPGGYEVICGARRLRAATIAGAKTVPVRVRYDLDDVAALEAMVAENSQRADVAPLEESDAYEALLERGRDVAAIAAKLGRSESYVRARLRLQRLGPEGRMLLEHGLLTLTGALALAQLDAAPQRQAVEHMGPALRWPRVENWPDGFEGDEYGHWMPGVASGQHVRAAIKRACRVLAEAPWDLADAQLVPNAGACASCPRRTAAQAELFGDADGEDLCLDGACWEAKVDGWWTARRAELEAAGATVLEGDAAKSVIAWGCEVRHDSGLVTLDEPAEVYQDLDPDEPEVPTWREIVGELAVEDLTVICTPKGELVEALDEELAWSRVQDRYPNSAESAARVREARRARSSNGTLEDISGDYEERRREHAERERKRREKAKRDEEVIRRCAATLRSAIADGPGELDAEVLRALVRVAVQHSSTSAVGWVLNSRGQKVPAYFFDSTSRITKLAKPMDRGELLALLVELVLAPAFAQAAHRDPLAAKAGPRQVLKHYGVDVAHHRREARKASRASKKKPSKMKAPKAPKKKAPKKKASS